MKAPGRPILIELCGCKSCCEARPGRAAKVARQRSVFKRRFEAEFGLRRPRGEA